VGWEEESGVVILPYQPNSGKIGKDFQQPHRGRQRHGYQISPICPELTLATKQPLL
jgi:hypothetical protein